MEIIESSQSVENELKKSVKYKGKKKFVFELLLFLSPVIFYGILFVIGRIIFNSAFQDDQTPAWIYKEIGLSVWFTSIALSISGFVFYYVCKSEKKAKFILFYTISFLLFIATSTLGLCQNFEGIINILTILSNQYPNQAPYLFVLVISIIVLCLHILVAIFFIISIVYTFTQRKNKLYYNSDTHNNKKTIFMVHKKSSTTKILLFTSPAILFGFFVSFASLANPDIMSGYFAEWGILSIALFISAGLYFLTMNRTKKFLVIIVFQIILLLLCVAIVALLGSLIVLGYLGGISTVVSSIFGWGINPLIFHIIRTVFVARVFLIYVVIVTLFMIDTVKILKIEKNNKQNQNKGDVI